MPALKCRAAPQGRLHRSTFAVCKCLFVLLLFAGSPSCSVTVGTQWEMYHFSGFPLYLYVDNADARAAGPSRVPWPSRAPATTTLPS